MSKMAFRFQKKLEVLKEYRTGQRKAPAPKTKASVARSQRNSRSIRQRITDHTANEESFLPPPDPTRHFTGYLMVIEGEQEASPADPGKLRRIHCSRFSDEGCDRALEVRRKFVPNFPLINDRICQMTSDTGIVLLQQLQLSVKSIRS